MCGTEKHEPRNCSKTLHRISDVLAGALDLKKWVVADAGPHRVEQCLTCLEMIVKRAARYSGGADESIDGSVIAAVVGHDAGGRLYEPVAHAGAPFATNFRSPCRHWLSHFVRKMSILTLVV